MTTETTPRFARTTARGSALGLENPLPPTLAGLPQVRERADEHARLAERLTAQRAAVVEVSRELVETDAADERARVAAVSKGRPLPKAKAEAVRAKLEAAESERDAVEQAVVESADALLVVAVSHLSEAAELVRAAQERSLARVRDLLDAVDGALEDESRLVGEAFWLDFVEGRPRVEPYRPMGDKRINQLRLALRQAVEQFLARRAEAEAEREREAAWEAANREAWAQQEEKARRDYEAGKVVYEGQKLVSRGGRPVTPSGAFQDAEDDETS
jgi:hypothetical protein